MDAMKNTACENYLYDLAQRILNDALEARNAWDSLVKQGVAATDCCYESSRALAYYEVLSIVINLAYSFDLDLAILGLEGVNPDTLLLSRDTK